MKSLYFVGNEELWNDAWFRALVESLKSRSITVVLLDSVADALDVKEHARKLSVYERMIFQKNLDPVLYGTNLGFSFAKDKISLVYALSDSIDPAASHRQIAFGITDDEFLTNIGLWEASQVIEEAFILDENLASEVSRAVEGGQHSLINGDLLVADTSEIEKLIEGKTTIQPSPELEFDAEPKIKVEPELNLEVDLDEALKEVADLKVANEQASVSLQVEEEEANKTVLIKPVEASEVVATVLNQEAMSPEVSPEASRSSAPAFVEVSQILSSMSQSVSGEDIEVLKRYASIKERELRESQAATEALRRQIRYFDERLKKSEEERRKLLLKLEETDNELRTVADKKDENKAQLRSIESRYEEKVKELLVQLESSQFQAGKLEKKLIDFKERVRNDLQKIRSRERELASRLEIQKRDAEALLSAKDERLLNQKREMDRLEFDMDSLKERLLDDAQKNEEKRKRVARALQSLKLAQSILSGLEEDIIVKDEKDKAA